MSFLLDTNVISELRRPGADPGVRRWFASVASGDLFLSTLVLGEIRGGIERLRGRDLAQAQIFETWLELLRNHYSDRLLPVTAAVAEEWGRLNAPDPVPVVDGLMAATARVHQLTLVTRNIRDLKRTGVALLNPFSK